MKDIIPTSSSIYSTIETSAKSAKVVVFSGLPGVGKSLYINQFKIIATALGRTVTVIQWDIARKAFETEKLLKRFPLGDGVIHNGIKLCAGKWLVATLSKWLVNNKENKNILLIEAPLVGHRFIELAQIQENNPLEDFLKSKAFQVIVPIPSAEVRKKIEEARAAQLSENAKVWVGAKPSVMLHIWKLLCEIANKMGKHISLEEQPPYDPIIYEFVIGKVLKHRNFIPLHIDEIFDVSVENEAELHNTGSLKASKEEADLIGESITKTYTNDKEINTIVANWYNT